MSQQFEPEYFPFEKTGHVRFEPRTFVVSGVSINSRLKVPETQKNSIHYELNLNLPFLILTILRTKLFTEEKSIPDCSTLAHRKVNQA